MRKYMSPRITLRRVAAMGQISADRLLAELTDLAGDDVIVIQPISVAPQSLPASPRSAPTWMPSDPDIPKLPHVNVLAIDDVFGDPLPPINAGLKRLPIGGVLMIRHRWEPQPHYDVWNKMGLEWFARQASEDEWRVFVYRPTSAPQPAQQVTSVVDLRALPQDERGPRLVAMFEQLLPDESMEVWAADHEGIAQAKSRLDEQNRGKYRVSEQLPRKEGVAVEISRTG